MNNQFYSGSTATQTTGTSPYQSPNPMLFDYYLKKALEKELVSTLSELKKDDEEIINRQKAPLIETLPELPADETPVEVLQEETPVEVLQEETPVEVLQEETPVEQLNELVKWDEIEHQIDIERDISVLIKYHAVLGNKEFRKQLDGSIRGINKCEKYKIKVEMAFGDYYKKLENNAGRPEKFVNQIDELSPKQHAKEEIGKSRETISKYTQISNINNREKFLDKFESECNDKGLEMSSAGFLNFATNKKTNSKELCTDDNEWYTPIQFITKVRKVMGSIDVDPASCDFAQKTVKATEYFTIETNGLDKNWTGNIFLNPPFSGKEIHAFTDKFIEEFKSGNIKQGIVLTNSDTDTGWFHKLMEITKVVCFTKGKVKFYNKERIGAPTNGQVFFYIGENEEKFKKYFSGVGLIMKRYD